MSIDRELISLCLGVLGLLVAGTIAGLIVRARAASDAEHRTAENVVARIRAWWIMAALFILAVLSGDLAPIVLFGFVSLLALREFVSVVPTSRADHPALLASFFLVIPGQYLLVWYDWYGLFVIFIPVYCFLLLTIRMALAGDNRGFLERVAKLQWGLMVCVYCVSYAPAILKLRLPEYRGEDAKLLLFFVIVVELGDVCQFLWGKSIGKRKITPRVSPNKTWGGFVGGVLTAAAIGAGLWWATPFSPIQAFGIALMSAVLGFAGDISMSAIKRDTQIKDYGTVLQGHGGILDRIDSLCFAAPFFFHIVRFFFGGPTPVVF